MSGAIVAQAINESIGTPGFQGLDAILKEYLGLIAEQAGTARVPISRTINGHSLASDVDLDNNDVSAAPARFGLGEGAKEVTGENINEVTKGGWYWWHSAENSPKDWCYMLVNPSADGGPHHCTQIIFDMLSPTVFKRTSVLGTWGESEYVNPPMVIGEEYCTTERYNDKPVYTKLIYCGKATSNKTVQTGHATIFRHSGNLNMNSTLPYFVSSHQGINWAESRASGETLTLVCGSGFEGNHDWYEQIWWI